MKNKPLQSEAIQRTSAEVILLLCRGMSLNMDETDMSYQLITFTEGT